MHIINLNHLNFKYKNTDHFSIDLDHFSIKHPQQVFLEGPSGCGKTTFLNLLTGLIPPNSGTIEILGTTITEQGTLAMDQFRADHFGIIFQLFNLIPHLNVMDNIVLPCTFSKTKKNNALKHGGSLSDEAKRLCDQLSIGKDLIHQPIHHLSIGQQQRVAIARALIGQPEIIIADEPTSALDQATKDQFMRTLLHECKQNQSTLIFVSHDTELRPQFDTVIEWNNLNKGAVHGTP